MRINPLKQMFPNFYNLRPTHKMFHDLHAASSRMNSNKQI
jgi:hypothetical protein